MWRCSVLFVLVLAACGGGTSAPDARVVDASVDAVSIDAYLQCSGAAQCASLAYANTCVGGSCVECAGAADCTASALGPTCNAGQCQCASVDDCASNANGHVCDPTLHACSCGGDQDCATGTCQPQPYLGPGAKTCQ